MSQPQTQVSLVTPLGIFCALLWTYIRKSILSSVLLQEFNHSSMLHHVSIKCVKLLYFLLFLPSSVQFTTSYFVSPSFNGRNLPVNTWWKNVFSITSATQKQTAACNPPLKQTSLHRFFIVSVKCLPSVCLQKPF